MELGNAQLLDYAVSKFQDGKYDEALEAFILAYGRGYEQEWIIENIYSCYMWGNDELYRKTYEKYGSEAGLSYEDCVLDFIPYKDGEYYIFDKEIGIFRGVFSVKELENTEIQESIKKVEFSAVGFEMDWNWNEKMHILAAAKERKIYAISHDIPRVLSYFKIPELQAYMKNVKIFSGRQEFQDYFHRNTSVYLPYVVLGKEEERKPLLEVIEQEHQYRLTPEGRNTNNVLLTIGIPTYNRGNLVLKRLENLCRMPYDAEIEFAISKNGTLFYQEEYEAVSRMTDARINYFDHGRELKASENWHYTIEMAHGKYVLLVSDEDDVCWGALEHYFKLLQSNSDVNLIRAKTAIQYGTLNEKRYGKKGTDAFYAMFLRQNYLSGMIIRREDFMQANLLQLEQFSDNAFYRTYPHEWWCAMLSRTGDYMEEPVILIDENESVIAEEAERVKKEGIIVPEGEGMEENSQLPVYATYKARLNQFQGQIDFVRWFMKDDKNGMELGFGQSFGKVTFLLEMAREYNYDNEKFEEFVDRFLWICMDAIDEAPLDQEQKVHLLQWARQLGIDALEMHKRLSIETVGDKKG